MPADTFTFYDSFAEAPLEKIHNFGSDALTVALSNTAGDIVTANHSQLSTITQIIYTNVSTSPNASRVLGLTSSSQSAGTYSFIIPDMTITAVTGAIPTFQYVIVYNDTATNDELVGFLDYGTPLDIALDESLLLDFSAVSGLFQATLV